MMKAIAIGVGALVFMLVFNLACRLVSASNDWAVAGGVLLMMALAIAVLNVAGRLGKRGIETLKAHGHDGREHEAWRDRKPDVIYGKFGAR